MGRVWLHCSRLDRCGPDPTQWAVTSVRGNSIELALPNGCSILMAHDRRQRHADWTFIARTNDGLRAKRACEGGGNWQLVNDADPLDWPPTSWPNDTGILGQVVWMAQTLVGMWQKPITVARKK